MAVESWLTFSYHWSTVQVINGQGIFQPGEPVFWERYTGRSGLGWGLPQEALCKWKEEANPLLPRSKGYRKLVLDVCFLLEWLVQTSFHPCLKK